MGSEREISSGTIMIAAIALGAAVGVGSVAYTPNGRTALATKAEAVAVASGAKRLREPQAGDHWGGCNDARAAGTAPIYRDEPGYRTDMDGDDDGIACEAH